MTYALCVIRSEQGAGVGSPELSEVGRVPGERPMTTDDR
jgi:hypothetical protein